MGERSKASVPPCPSAAMNIGAQPSFSIMVCLGYMPHRGIVRSYGSFILSFLRNLHNEK